MPTPARTLTQVPCSRNRHKNPRAAFTQDELLQKANKLKQFLAEQQGRTQHAASKTSWTVAWQQLCSERKDQEKQLVTQLNAAAAREPELEPGLQELLQERQAAAQRVASLQTTIDSHVRTVISTLKAAHQGAAVDGSKACPAAAQQLLRKLQAALQSSQEQLDQMERQYKAELQQAMSAATSTSCEPEDFDTTSAAAAAAEVAHRGNACTSLTTGADGDSMDAALHETHASVKDQGSSSAACNPSTQQLPPLTNSCSHLEELTAAHNDSTLRTNRSSVASSTSCGAAGSRGSSSCSELEQLIQQHYLAPEEVLTQLREAWQLLSAKHRQQLLELQARSDTGVSAQASSCSLVGTRATGGSSSSYTPDGWTAQEHRLFLHLREVAHKSVAASSSAAPPGLHSGGISLKGSSRAVVMAELQQMMPQFTRQQLLAHERWYTQQLLLERRQRDATTAWQRQKRSFLEEAAQQLQTAHATAEAAVAAAPGRLAQEVLTAQLHDQVVAIRALKGQQQQRQAEALAKAQAEAAERQAAAQEEEAARRAVEREKVAAFQAAREQQEAAAAAARAAAEAEAAAALAAEVEAHRPAVAVRHALWLDKVQEQKAKLAEQQAAAARQQALLDEMAAAVAPQVPRDPARVLAPTAASSAVPPPAGSAFCPVHGYNTQQLLSDQRFRLLEALGEAGLRGASHAVQALSRLPPMRTMRVDALTTTQQQALAAGHLGN